MTTRTLPTTPATALPATAALPTTPAPPTTRPGRGSLFLRAAAMAATLPYLTLKGAWLAGSHLGIPPGSVLLDPGPFFMAVNAVSMAMDATVVLLVLLLTRPWGLRVPSWALTVPVFAATGLLTPIVLGYPGQLLVQAAGLGADGAARAAAGPFLDPWVFGVVYGGFIVQGIALAGLFVPYARRRWGRLWQGAPGRRLPSPTGVVAGAAAVAGAVTATAYLYWTCGGGAGLSARRAAEYSAETGVVSAVHALCALAAAAGAVLLARGGPWRAAGPLALTWVGAAAALSWGTWLLFAALAPETGPADSPGGGMVAAYAGQMLTGLLAAAVLIRFLRSRRTV
ncbi:hypothetical protein ACGFXC_20610 [Streptomyces sp. NPDC048507]|uniref:hypothetical protein n=1 Tax=Streptomyces sp. NPDC048507 TaxID=3365560 RepID=UPI00371AD696